MPRQAIDLQHSRIIRGRNRELRELYEIAQYHGWFVDARELGTGGQNLSSTHEAASEIQPQHRTPNAKQVNNDLDGTEMI